MPLNENNKTEQMFLEALKTKIEEQGLSLPDASSSTEVEGAHSILVNVVASTLTVIEESGLIKFDTVGEFDKTMLLSLTCANIAIQIAYEFPDLFLHLFDDANNRVDADSLENTIYKVVRDGAKEQGIEHLV